MASYESLRSTAYSEDLRWRIVYQRKALEYSVRQKLLVRGKRVSAIGALSGSGMLGCHMVEGSVNADTFEEFIEKSLLPNLYVLLMALIPTM